MKSIEEIREAARRGSSRPLAETDEGIGEYQHPARLLPDPQFRGEDYDESSTELELGPEAPRLAERLAEGFAIMQGEDS
ncbi:MAG: hypothetical protein AB7R40_23235 [Nitrospiraceae bacterium]